MKDTLLEWAGRRGYQVAWGPTSVFERARGDLERRERNGEIDATFARANLSFDFDGVCGEDWRVLVVVVPRPAHLVGFVANGVRIDAVLPPTYERYRATFEDVRRDLSEHALPGCRLTTINAPLKTLASLLGLVRYGRNNLTYAPAIGSYLQLLGYVTDAPLPVEPDWTPREPVLCDECATCGICAALCPTDAIGQDRILLRAERCLTLANETPGAWPSHVSPEAHHCLIGCLLCQRDCPANPELPIVRSGVVFTAAETQALMAGGDHACPAWAGIRAKLEALGQPYQEDVLGRNLRALVAPRRRTCG